MRSVFREMIQSPLILRDDHRSEAERFGENDYDGHYQQDSFSDYGVWDHNGPEDYYDDDEPEEEDAPYNRYHEDDYYSDYEPDYRAPVIRQVRINGRLVDPDWEYGEERQYPDTDDEYYTSEDDRDRFYDPEYESDHDTPPVDIPIFNELDRRVQQQRWINESRQARDAFVRSQAANPLVPPQSLHVATKAGKGEEACFICMDNKPDSAFDCGHSGVCCVCADTLLKTTQKCPLCRKPVTSFSAAKPREPEKEEDEVPDAWDDV